MTPGTRWAVSLCFFLGSGLQLYELDSDPERKEFLDDLFIFMQKRGKCGDCCVTVTQPACPRVTHIIGNQSEEAERTLAKGGLVLPYFCLSSN